MPYVNIKITKEGVTDKQKKQLMEGATQLLVDVLNKNPATTIVVMAGNVRSSPDIRSHRILPGCR